jgi:hypothetical protein
VTHKADSLELAIEGAASKLENALEHLFGKLRVKRAAVEKSSESVALADAMREEEFLENERAALHG